MVKREIGFVVLSLIAVLFSFALVSAVGVTLTSINSTDAQIGISSVTGLYAYEVNFDHTGDVTAVTQANYITVVEGDSQYGYNERGTITSVYGSRLDNAAAGVDGSGNLFNITYTGTLTLRYALFVYTNDTREYVYYNNTAAAAATTESSVGGGGGAYVPPNKTKITVVQDNSPASESPGMESGLGGGGFGNATTTGKIISDFPSIQVGNTVKSLIRSLIEFFIRLFGGTV